MKKKILILSALAAGVALASTANAADVRINGFASIGMGKTMSQGQNKSPNPANPFSAVVNTNTYAADKVTEGYYDEDWSFKPDSNYGLQITSDLGSGLTITGQVTGNGGEDFDAIVSWAYVKYELDEHWNVMAGRQRLPLFYYSDFIDVGYAYHWIRPPQDLAAASYDTFEGIKLNRLDTLGNWDLTSSVYYGSGDEDIQNGLARIKSEDLHGFLVNGTNGWLTLRGTYFHNSIVIQSSSSVNRNAQGVAQGTEDNPQDYTFYALAANMQFENNTFVVAEWTNAEPDDGAFGSYNGLAGNKSDTGWYISTGIRLGDFTPHITYGERTVDFVAEGGPLAPVKTDFEEKSETITVGLRWDFHPSAAFKVEYLTRADKSDDFFQNKARIVGYGDRNEVDLVSMAVDVVF